MFKIFQKKDKRTPLEKEIESILILMGETDPTSEDYKTMVNSLEILCKSLPEKGKGFDWAPIIIIGGNLLITVLVLAFEKDDTITSKVSSFIFKGRA